MHHAMPVAQAALLQFQSCVRTTLLLSHGYECQEKVSIHTQVARAVCIHAMSLEVPSQYCAVLVPHASVVLRHFMLNNGKSCLTLETPEGQVVQSAAVCVCVCVCVHVQQSGNSMHTACRTKQRLSAGWRVHDSLRLPAGRH